MLSISSQSVLGYLEILLLSMYSGSCHFEQVASVTGMAQLMNSELPHYYQPSLGPPPRESNTAPQFC